FPILQAPQKRITNFHQSALGMRAARRAEATRNVTETDCVAHPETGFLEIRFSLPCPPDRIGSRMLGAAQWSIKRPAAPSLAAGSEKRTAGRDNAFEIRHPRGGRDGRVRFATCALGDTRPALGREPTGRGPRARVRDPAPTEMTSRTSIARQHPCACRAA